MRKQLRFFMTALLMAICGVTWAQEVSYDFTDGTWAIENYVLSNGTVDFTGSGPDKWTINTDKDGNPLYFFFGKQGATLTFPKFNFDVEKIVVTGRSGASGNTLMNLYVGDQEVSTETKGSTGVNTYEIANDYQDAGTVYTLKVNSSHNAQITKIDIYKKKSISSPSFSPEGGIYYGSIKVSINCETSGATIYYTTDESDPSSSSTQYTGPISVDESMTIKAIAYVGSQAGNVSQATYTIVYPKTIAEVREQGTGNISTSGIVTSYSENSSGVVTAYMQDETAGICVFFNSSLASIKVGDEISVEGSLTTYNGLLEIKPTSIDVLSSGNTITPDIMLIKEITDDNEGWLVKIEDATVTAIEGQNVTIAQGEATIVVRFNSTDDITFDVDDTITLTGNVGDFKGVQIANPTDVSIKPVTSVEITIPESGSATFCSKYPIEIEDQEVFIVTDVTSDKAKVQKLESGTVVAAGVGLLVKGSGTVEFNVSDEAGTEPEGNKLVGTLKAKDLSDSEAYILYEGKFYLCTEGVFPAGKAYLPAAVVPSGAKIITFGDETTGINELKAQNSLSEIYTIGGIRVKNAQQKGIYIINGKKVVR